MKTYVSTGHSVDVAAPYDVLSGHGALVGSLFGVAGYDAKSGATVTLHCMGVFNLAATASQAWTVGQLIYWDDTNKCCITTASSNKLIGVAILAHASDAAVVTGVVKLNGGASN